MFCYAAGYEDLNTPALGENFPFPWVMSDFHNVAPKYYSLLGQEAVINDKNLGFLCPCIFTHSN